MGIGCGACGKGGRVEGGGGAAVTSTGQTEGGVINSNPLTRHEQDIQSIFYENIPNLGFSCWQQNETILENIKKSEATNENALILTIKDIIIKISKKKIYKKQYK